MFIPNSMYNYSCPENILRYELLKRMRNGLGDNIFSIYPYFDFDRARTIYAGMIKAGYLEPITLEDFLQGMTLAELKPLCKESGLKVSGKKADLIASLISNVGLNEPSISIKMPRAPQSLFAYSSSASSSASASSM